MKGNWCRGADETVAMWRELGSIPNDRSTIEAAVGYLFQLHAKHHEFVAATLGAAVSLPVEEPQ